MKIKVHKESNYKGIHINGKTLRIALDQSKPILALPIDKKEFADIKCTNTCRGACAYCYQNSVPNEEHYKDIVKKFNSYFGLMSENDRPFQIAIGGGCMPDSPEFSELLKASFDLGIIPNYTTNGMWSEDS